MVGQPDREEFLSHFCQDLFGWFWTFNLVYTFDDSFLGSRSQELGASETLGPFKVLDWIWLVRRLSGGRRDGCLADSLTDMMIALLERQTLFLGLVLLEKNAST